MFEALAQAVEELAVPADPSALTEVWALVDPLTAKATMAAATFDEHELWDADGDTSMTAWLRHHAGMTSRDAAVVTGTERRLRCAPLTADAWLAGDLAGGQVAAVVATVREETVDLWAQHEPAVLPTLTPLPVHQVTAAMRVWAQRAEALVGARDEVERPSALHLSRTMDGRGELAGTFEPEIAELVATALRVGTGGDATGEPRRTPAERRAEAFGDICQLFLDHHHATAGGRHRPHLNLVVDLDQRAAGDPAAACTVDGTTTSSETISRLLCDSGVHRVLTAGRSTIIDDRSRHPDADDPCAAVQRARRAQRPLPLGRLRPPGFVVRRAPRAPLGGRRPDAPRQPRPVVPPPPHPHPRRGWQIELLPDATVAVANPDGIVETTRSPPRC